MIARRLLEKISLKLINKQTGFEEEILKCAGELYEIVVSNEIKTREIIGRSEGKVEKIDKLSYAIVAASDKMDKNIPEPQETLVLRSSSLSVNEMEEVLRRNINPNGNDIKMQDVIKTRRGKIIIKSKKIEDVRKLERMIGENDNMRDIKTKISTKKNPRIILFNVDRGTGENEVLDAVREQLEARGEVKLIDRLQRRQGNNWVLEIDPVDFSRNKDKDNICISWERVHMKEYVSILQCFGCGELGHRKMECKTGERCYGCGMADHRTDTCRNRPSCINCRKDNLKFGKDYDTAHSCWNRRCMSREVRIERQRKYIDYGP